MLPNVAELARARPALVLLGRQSEKQLPTCVGEDAIQLRQRGVSVLSVGAAPPGLLLGQRLRQRRPLGVAQASEVHAERLGEGPEGARDARG